MSDYTISTERKDALTDGIEDPVRYVVAVLSELGVSPKPDGRLVRTDPTTGITREEDLDVLTSLVRTQYRSDHSFLSANLTKKEKRRLINLTNQSLMDGLTLLLARNREEHERRLVDTLKYVKGDESAPERMRTYLEALLDAPAPDMLVGAMLHWLCCVKQQLHRKAVTWHIVPVFVGPNGLGKSVALDRLLGPLSDDVYSINDVAAATEEQGRLSLARSLIVRFDEMARVDKADVGKLKGLITSQKVTTRILHTNLHSTRSTRTSFIGTSNYDLSSSVNDPSGMRRWLQVTCERRSRWDTINSFDALALWRSVDENHDYRTSIATELEAEQEDMRRKTPVEFFVETYGLRPLPEGDTERAPYRSLYEEYKTWARETGEEPLSLRTVTNALRSLRFATKKSNGECYVVTACPRTTEEGRTSRKEQAGYDRMLQLLDAPGPVVVGE